MYFLRKFVSIVLSIRVQDPHVHLLMWFAELVHTGGDQMTAARARGSQRVRSNSERGKDRLEGLQPVVEDWHAKVCLLGVC